MRVFLCVCMYTYVCVVCVCSGYPYAQYTNQIYDVQPRRISGKEPRRRNILVLASRIGCLTSDEFVNFHGNNELITQLSQHNCVVLFDFVSLLVNLLIHWLFLSIFYFVS